MEQAQLRAPRLRPETQFRRLGGGRVLISHPKAVTQICEPHIAEALKLCQGQAWAEMMEQARHILENEYSEQEWGQVLAQVADFGFFEGHAKRHPRVRLFDPTPAVEFLARRCRWLFSRPMVVALILLLFAGLWQLFSHWGLFVSSVERAAGNHPLLSIALFYFCFLPVGLLHELAHGAVCRWFGGEVIEVGLRKDSANLYVISNTAVLTDPRARVLYFAGGALLDMFVFFPLVTVWVLWPSYVTLMFLLPQALFILQFSYAMEAGSDLSRIVSQWTRTAESRGRLAFVKEFLKDPPKGAREWRRAGIYLGSIALQAVVAAYLIWSFRKPVSVTVWPEIALQVPFLPVLLYLAYRALRKAFLGLSDHLRAPG